jgi:hypothetical protein
MRIIFRSWIRIQWLQISITLKRSWIRIRIRIEVKADPGPHLSEKLGPHLSDADLQPW